MNVRMCLEKGFRVSLKGTIQAASTKREKNLGNSLGIIEYKTISHN
jgi:hypothetical protein